MSNDYTWLQEKVAEFLNRADLYASIPTFIALAEAQMWRRFTRSGMQSAVAQATLSVATEYQNVPTGFAGLFDAQVYDAASSRWLPLEPVTMTGMATLKSDRESVAAIPDRITVVGTQFQFSPTPDQAYSVNITYSEKPPVLTAAAPTNWIINDNPDVYLYGALAHAGPYIGADPRIPIWRQMFDQATGEIVSAERRKRGPRFTPSFRATDVPPNYGRRRFSILNGQ